MIPDHTMHEIFSRSHRGPPQTIANAHSLVAAAMYSPPILMLKLRSDERQHHQPSNCALNSLSLYAREAPFPIFFPSTEQFITENNREQQIPTCTSLTFFHAFSLLALLPTLAVPTPRAALTVSAIILFPSQNRANQERSLPPSFTCSS